MDANKPPAGVDDQFKDVMDLPDAFAPGVDLSTPSKRLQWIESVKAKVELVKSVSRSKRCSTPRRSLRRVTRV